MRPNGPTRRRRWWRWAIAIVVGGPALALAGAIYWLGSMDQAALKQRLEAMATRALRREVHINGDVALSLLPTPSLTAEGLRVGRLGSADEMRVRLAVAPLLTGRVVLDTILLDRPILRLPPWSEAAQEPSPPRQQSAPPASTGMAGAPRVPRRIEIRRLDVEDATLILPDGRSIGGINAQIGERDGTLTLAAQGRLPEADPAEANAAAQSDAAPRRLVAVQATLAPADRLGGHLQASLSAPGLTLGLDGALAIAARRFEGTISATAANLADAASLAAPYATLPSLPALHDVTLSAHAEGPWRRPSFTALHLAAGAAPLDRIAPGLALVSASIDAAAPEGPFKGSMALTADGQPIALAGTLDALPLARPAKLVLDAAGAGAHLHADGTIGWPIPLRPLSLRLDLHADDMARLGEAFHRALPAGAASLSGQFDAPVALSDGWTLSGFDLTAPFGTLHGSLGHAGGARPFWQASLGGRDLDLDPLFAAMRSSAASPADKVAPASAAAPVPASPAPRDRLIPDTRLPAGWLRDNDAKLALDATHLTLRGQTLDTLRLAASLDHGKLAIEPAEARGPAGSLNLRLQADADANPMSGHASLQVPGMALGPLLAAFGVPGESEAPARLEADLSGGGDTMSALAGSLSGTIDLHAGPGQIDNRAVEALFGRALRAASLPADIGGRSELRCLDAAATLKDGRGALTRLALDTTRLAVEGSGGFDLGAETLDLHLRPLLRLGHAGAAIPVHVVGNFADPKTSLDASGPDGRVSLVIGALAGGAEESNPCGPAPASAALPAPATPGAKVKGPKAADLLRKLLGQ